jgi:hypothetical protein
MAVAMGTDLDGFLVGLVAGQELPQDQRELRAVMELLSPLDADALRAVRELVKAHLAGVKAAKGR